ncbi:MAG: hypothetical protein WBQ43_00980 [Terriglobales bacterium]
MFEAEVEMERRSSFLPLLLMMCLVVAIVGLAGYVILQVRGTPLSAQKASVMVTAALQQRAPAAIHFRTGLVKPTADEKPDDPNYRLLEKAGIVKVAKAAGGKVEISLTPAGDQLLASVAGCKKEKEADGTDSYEVPLAQRQLVAIGNITTSGTNATIDYTWKWSPNQFGDVFDAGGSLVKSFNLWDRQTLINKYNADFYHGDPTKATLALVHKGQDWKIPTP